MATIKKVVKEVKETVVKTKPINTEKKKLNDGESLLLTKIKRPKKSDDDTEDIETLDQVKKRFEKKAKVEGFIAQDELFDAIEHLELSDEDTDQLVLYFKSKEIDVKVEEEEEIEEEEEEIEEEDEEVWVLEEFKDTEGYECAKITDERYNQLSEWLKITAMSGCIKRPITLWKTNNDNFIRWNHSTPNA